VPVGEILEHMPEQGLDPGFIQPQNALDDMDGMLPASGAERAGDDPARIGTDIFQCPVRQALEQARDDRRIREDGSAQLLMGDQGLGFDLNGRFIRKKIFWFDGHDLTILVLIRYECKQPQHGSMEPRFELRRG